LYSVVLGSDCLSFRFFTVAGNHRAVARKELIKELTDAGKLVPGSQYEQLLHVQCYVYFGLTPAEAIVVCLAYMYIYLLFLMIG